MLEREPLSNEQKEALRECMRSLQVFVQKYKISSEPLDEDEVDELAENEPHRLFSIQEFHASPASAILALESPLIPGYDEESETHFESVNAWVEDSSEESWPYTEVFFECQTCAGAESAGDACDNCDGGQLIYELFWDEVGNVNFERAL